MTTEEADATDMDEIESTIVTKIDVATVDRKSVV